MSDTTITGQSARRTCSTCAASSAACSSPGASCSPFSASPKVTPRSRRPPASTSTSTPGSACSSSGIVFLLWAFTRPLGRGTRRVRGGERERRGRRRGHPPAGRLRGGVARGPNRRSRRRPSGRRRLRRPSGASRWPRPRARTPRSRLGARRARRRAARRPSRGRARRAPAAVASTRSFSLITWRARLSSVPSRPSSVASRSDVDAERLAGRAALGAALVVARGGDRVRGAGVERDQLPVAEVERVRLDVERAEVDPQHVAGRDISEAIWSSRPVSAPTQSFSTREHSLASCLRSSGGAAEQRERERGLERRGGREPAAARQVAGDLQPRGRDLEAGGAQLGHHPARERAPALGRARARRTRRCSPRSSAWTSKRCAGVAVTVTPRSIANGIASPSL